MPNRVRIWAPLERLLRMYGRQRPEQDDEADKHAVLLLNDRCANCHSDPSEARGGISSRHDQTIRGPEISRPRRCQRQGSEMTS